jgi:hypothetical protein
VRGGGSGVLSAAGAADAASPLFAAGGPAAAGAAAVAAAGGGAVIFEVGEVVGGEAGDEAAVGCDEVAFSDVTRHVSPDFGVVDVVAVGVSFVFESSGGASLTGSTIGGGAELVACAGSTGLSSVGSLATAFAMTRFDSAVAA